MEGGGTATPATTAPWARCSSSRPPGAPTPSTPMATARPIRSTSTTRHWPQPTTSASPVATCGPTPGSAGPCWPTTTPTSTSPRCWALARAYANGIPVADLPIVGDTSGPVPPPSGFYGAPAAPGPAIGARDMTSSPPDRTTGQSPQPAEADAPPAQASPPTGDSTVQPAASSTGSGPAPKPGPAHAPNPGQSPATPSEGRPAPPASAPAPAPLPPPAIPLPLPPPPLPSTVAPLPPTELIPGVTCGLLGLPVCPTG